MNLKVGDVVRKPNGIFIVTDISSESGIDYEDFKDFINKNYAIEFDGEHRTLHEISQMLSEEYLKKGDRTIIELNASE
ncbi:hypothetical protein ACOMCU_24970 [Lysinibacillus sp. UGB7]|uniref:hypothetical protein n=1 Tax=Lysinibacillus sp. UGB7 TaxID=3411039 RepID=UPI003B82413B